MDNERETSRLEKESIIKDYENQIAGNLNVFLYYIYFPLLFDSHLKYLKKNVEIFINF